MSTTGGAAPLSSSTACALGPFARRRVCGRVLPGIGHHPQVVQDTYSWGVCSRLSVTHAGRRL